MRENKHGARVTNEPLFEQYISSCQNQYKAIEKQQKWKAKKHYRNQGVFANPGSNKKRIAKIEIHRAVCKLLPPVIRILITDVQMN